MRPLILTTAGLLAFGAALAAWQDGGLFGPPERGGSRGGARRAPESTPVPDDDPGRTPGEREALPPEVIELGGIYFGIADYNGDGWISYREAKESLRVESRERYGRIDRNTDGRVDREEFQLVFEMTVRKLGEYPPPKPDPDGDPIDMSEFDVLGDGTDEDFQPAATIEELFGRAETRTLEEGATRQPPFIAGPISHFRRLDLDLSGEITEDDLVELLRPMQVRTRIRAVIGIMDLDESGGISRDEFIQSMSHDRTTEVPETPPVQPR